MASTRDIRRRIKSVKNTRQITRAMELVATSKMKKAQQAALAGRPYAQLMADMLAALAPRVSEAQHPFLVSREVKTRGILLVTTDIGLCGALNANLFKLVTEVKGPAKFVAIGRKGARFLARTRRDIVADFVVHDQVPFAEVKQAVEFMMKLFLEGTIDTVEVIYARYKNTLVQEPTIRPVLPLASVKEFVQQLSREVGGAREVDDRGMVFEPDAKSVLEALLPFYVNRYIFQLLLSAKASEQSARMVAMKTAKDNATKLLGDLTLEYNKARQAAITQEILEIAAGQSTAA
ncbi:ATP synthase F1 subunit gamma [Horticoccus luteus]|uniref:ATP synthase gamma chain n=1 Tax=Horticoccus luteus TaxID=2862869 RepID=A0A8F9TU00_9BACT|nr:ATP synthase F1 subunit gamma [Horticoccus luteus]QYM79020.1 ATP synthase F1 subunit gamma [Horticoccus luteus]